MSLIEFSSLLEVYRNASFNGAGADGEAEVSVATKEVADLLKRVEDDVYATAETGVTLLDDVGKVQLGAIVKVRLDDPRSGFAVLAHDLDDLIKSPRGRLEEPRRYYLVDPAYAPGDASVPDPIARYRKVLALVKLFGNAASMLDATKSELVFVKDRKVTLPVAFNASDVKALDVDAADRLLGQFADELHHDQKCSILFEALVDLRGKHRADSAFRFILRNLDAIAGTVADGYRLFASSFSYSKIKSELEDARISYTQKIHKTIIDIQNQLLGIPVATIVVASQMKAPTACGPELLVNTAVLAGAWIFVLLLIVAVVNQWLTLNVIKDEIDQQEKALQRDFSKVSADFVGIFKKLKSRIRWHHAGLAIVLVIGISGGGLATYFNHRLAGLTPVPCQGAGGTKTGAGQSNVTADPAPQAVPPARPTTTGEPASKAVRPKEDATSGNEKHRGAG
jgi:hypothetical protein